MAANKRKTRPEKTKEKIRDTINTGLIVKKLQEHVTGMDADGNKLEKPTDLKGTQIRAAETLLARTMPTLSMSDIQTTDVTESYEDQLQGLKDMAGDNWREVFSLLGIADHETNQELN